MIDEGKIREYVRKAHDIAVSHGFHDEPRSDKHWLCLVDGEVMEAVDADRKQRYANRTEYERQLDEKRKDGHMIERRRFFFDLYIKATTADEIADTAIRIFDYIGERFGDSITYEGYGWDGVLLDGTFTEVAYNFTHFVMGPGWGELTNAIDFLYAWAGKLGIDLDWHIEQKMEYNRWRPKLHGKQY